MCGMRNRKRRMVNDSIFNTIIREATASGSSDIHLSEGEPPVCRVDGRLREYSGASLDRELIGYVLSAYAGYDLRESGEFRDTLDFAFSLQGERFRGHAYRQQGRISLALRRLETTIRGATELGLPQEVSGLADLRDGLVLVTGPTGSGKSTTLAALINSINLSRSCHILTIEDPVEYLYPKGQALIHQREINTDVSTFAKAVRASLREDPDIVLVGEMRDTETMAAAVRVAETGHLVFSTLHTASAVGAIDRIIGAFPSGERPSLLQQLSLTLKAVVAQTLLSHQSGRGRVVAAEILLVNPAAANLIRQHKTEQLYSVMESGNRFGMRTMEQSLAELVRGGTVSREEAAAAAGYPDLLRRRLESLGVS